MKFLFSLIIFLSSFFAFTQTTTIAGTYILKLESSNAVIVDTLTLHADETFTFHEYDRHDGGIPPERDKYGKGKWKFENNIVYFYANESDITKTHTLNFNNSEARFIIKSPRDKSNKVIPTSIQFYKSDIFWIVKRKLIKE
ncbi:hypothetical protein [Hanstruepera ponticola]|uniref:hypothetical protein n=1 Tax=Hanstruepera ponticola TaxID=2042995 RepID=UPI000CF0FE02|nr:hypothetical protein [Hanstruepera ponticola]